MALSADSPELRLPAYLNTSSAMKRIVDRHNRFAEDPNSATDYERLQNEAAGLKEKNKELTARVKGLEADLRVAVDEYSRAMQINKDCQTYAKTQQKRADKSEEVLKSLQKDERKKCSVDELLVEQVFADMLRYDADKKLADLQRNGQRIAEAAALRNEITRAIVDNVLLPAALRVEGLYDECLTPEDRRVQFRKQAEIIQRAVIVFKILAEQMSSMAAEMSVAGDGQSVRRRIDPRQTSANTKGDATVDTPVDPLRYSNAWILLDEPLNLEARLHFKFALLDAMTKVQRHRLEHRGGVSGAEIERLLRPSAMNYMLTRGRGRSWHRSTDPYVDDLNYRILSNQPGRDFPFIIFGTMSPPMPNEANRLRDADCCVQHRINQATKHS